MCILSSYPSFNNRIIKALKIKLFIVDLFNVYDNPTTYHVPITTVHGKLFVEKGESFNTLNICNDICLIVIILFLVFL